MSRDKNIRGRPDLYAGRILSYEEFISSIEGEGMYPAFNNAYLKFMFAPEDVDDLGAAFMQGSKLLEHITNTGAPNKD